MAFIVSGDLKVSCVFLSDRIGVIKINNLAVVGVYMVFYGGKNRVDNELEYAQDISMLDSTIIDLKSKKFEVVIVGDFNTDIRRDYSYTQTYGIIK